MKGLKSKLTQKLGPLPAWAWALVVVGLYLAWRFYQSKSTANNALAPAANPDNPSYYDGIYGGGIGGDAGGSGGGGGSSSGGGDQTGGGNSTGGDQTGGGNPDPPPYPDPDPGEVPDPPVPPHGAHGYKDPAKHPLNSKPLKGAKWGKVSPAVEAHKSKPLHKPHSPVISHAKSKTTSPAVSGPGWYPHAPQVPPHHAKKNKGRKG